MKRLLLAAVVCATAVFASETAFDAQEAIARIQNAPVQERRELMNAFKEKLAKMNGQERTEALQQLSARMGETTVAMNALAEGEMARVLQQQLATQTVRMENVERMGQKQAVEQFIQTHPEFQPLASGTALPPVSDTQTPQVAPTQPAESTGNVVAVMPFAVAH